MYEPYSFTAVTVSGNCSRKSAKASSLAVGRHNEDGRYIGARFELRDEILNARGVE